MLGILVQLALSWLIVWLVQKNDLRVLGLRPTKGQLCLFILFFLVTAFFSSSGFIMKMFFDGPRYMLNPQLDFKLIIDGIWWNIKSVMFEELIFRGVIFYILIKRLGMWKAILISSAAFGIYHWFSFGVLGQVGSMIAVFFITGIMGVVYAYGYAKTMSLYVPIGIHLGWNLIQNFVFSTGVIGNGILVPTDDREFRTDSVLVFVLTLVLPMLGAVVVNFFLLKRLKQVPVTVYDSSKFVETRK